LLRYDRYPTRHICSQPCDRPHPSTQPYDSRYHTPTHTSLHGAVAAMDDSDTLAATSRQVMTCAKRTLGMFALLAFLAFSDHTKTKMVGHWEVVELTLQRGTGLLLDAHGWFLIAPSPSYSPPKKCFQSFQSQDLPCDVVITIPGITVPVRYPPQFSHMSEMHTQFGFPTNNASHLTAMTQSAPYANNRDTSSSLGHR
jgi:hypothetical protein